VSDTSSPNISSVFFCPQLGSHVQRFFLPGREIVVLRYFSLFFLNVLGEREEDLIEGVVIESFFQERQGYFDFLCCERDTSAVI
jgi:hypothetical protein